MTLMPPDSHETCDVAVVGGGPAGLALATRLKQLGVGSVILLEREVAAGGIPRHCGHYPFGYHDFRRLMTGPNYARRTVAEAQAAGVDLRTGITVTALHEGGRLSLTSDAGPHTLLARRVALCTGARESSRAQRFIGGPRQHGVITTGALQTFVYLEGLVPFHRPVILGTELVSFSGLLTCRHAGIRPVAMIETGRRIVARAFARALPRMLGVPVFLGARIQQIIGDRCVEGVEMITDRGERRIIEADGVVCTGLFRPEAALLRSGHLDVDPATGGPIVDQYGHASDPAYICAGNLLRPIETHAWCAQEGSDTADRLAGGITEDLPKSLVTATQVKAAHSAIRYVLPQRLSANRRPGAMEHLQIRLSRAARGKLSIRADGSEIWSRRIAGLPERRVLAPLSALLTHRSAAAIDVGLEED